MNTTATQYPPIPWVEPQLCPVCKSVPQERRPRPGCYFYRCVGNKISADHNITGDETNSPQKAVRKWNEKVQNFAQNIDVSER
ncbi:MAG: hypothetical protein IJD43_06085 [Thermoguttaceae bacterium]|nr:hypothetical protein [Thermoguttaceae bacterium]